MSNVPRKHAAIVALGVILTLPSLRAGFFADDLLHISNMSGLVSSVFSAAPGDLFRFSSGDPVQVQKMIRASLFPWWTDLHLRAALFRPLSALTHLLDYHLWGIRPTGYHVTNLLLWTMVLLSAGALIRRLAPTPRAAMLSFMIYAISDGRAVVVTWIANRNALVATALAFTAVIAWDSFRRGAGKSRAMMAFGFFALALFAGEAALGGLALLIGYEALGLPDGRNFSARRFASALPFLAIAVVYAAGYKLAGYGTSGSGMYIDPSTNPIAWLAAAAVRFPTLLAGVLWSWPIDLWLSGGTTRTVLIAGAFILLPLSIGVFAQTVQRHRAIAAVALGGALALLPVTATIPGMRLLLLPGVAGALIIGAYLDAAWPLRSAGRVRAIIAALLGIRHLILAPLLLLSSVIALGTAFHQLQREILDSPWPPDLETRDVVLLDAPHWVSATYLRLYLGVAGRPFPRSAHRLNLSPYPAVFTRTGPATLEMRLRCGEMLTTEFERVERGTPMPAGTTVDAGLFRATVLEAGKIGPIAVRFDFERDLDKGPLFVRWVDTRYEPIAAPGEGGTIELPAISQGIGNLRAPAPVCGGR